MSYSPYTSNVEYLRHELRRVGILLERAVRQLRHFRAQNQPGEFRGLYISDAEIDYLITAMNELPNHAWADLEAKATAMQEEIQQRLTASEKADVFLRLPHLKTVFGLSTFETDLLLLTLAPELDLRYQKLYAYLQDDVTRKRPSVALAMQVFCWTLEEQITAREAFAETAPLFANLLLGLHEDATERPLPLLGRSLKVEDRVAEFLLGNDLPDARLVNPIWLMDQVTPQQKLQDLILQSSTRKTLENLVSLGTLKVPWVCLVQGAAGTGKKSAIAAVCQIWEKFLLAIDLPTMLQSDRPFSTLLRLALREARWYGQVIYFDGWHELLKNEPRCVAAKQLVEQELKRLPYPIFLGSESFWQPSGIHPYKFVAIEFTVPDEQLRQQLWQACLNNGLNNGHGIEPTVNFNHLAGAFRFSGRQIRQAIAHAESEALLHQGDNSTLTMSDLLLGCRTTCRQHLPSLARHIKPQRVWQDLVLPPDTLAQLQEFCQQVRYRVKVYADWGFNRKLNLGMGTIALFTGDSGTGKTLAAEIMAHELGFDLYKVDLSCVVSKYIGETEKNLNRVFEEAQQSNALLFFDEADALFGKRSEVKDAHDRYANIEINYLLQRVEEYEGIIILTSNFSRNIDPAFVRRLHFTIEFPVPDETHRLQIWQGIFPSQAPLAEEVDFEFLARQFKITGGNIKNVALSAAFRAAEDGGVIHMNHLMLAMKREYQKLRKVCERSEFQQYYELVRS